MKWFDKNHSKSRFVLGLNFGHFFRDCIGKFAAKMYNLWTQNKPWSRVIFVKPFHTFEREGSKVSFGNKTFTCVYVNFCSIAITINPILCETLPPQRQICACVILVTGCNVFVILQNRWLWCHYSKWFMKHKSLILMSSKIYSMHQKSINI